MLIVAFAGHSLSAVQSVSRKDVLKEEFQTYVNLGFSMHIELGEVIPHWNRTLSSVDLSTEAYLGPRLFAAFQDISASDRRRAASRSDGSVGGWLDDDIRPPRPPARAAADGDVAVTVNVGAAAGGGGGGGATDASHTAADDAGSPHVRIAVADE